MLISFLNMFKVMKPPKVDLPCTVLQRSSETNRGRLDRVLKTRETYWCEMTKMDRDDFWWHWKVFPWSGNGVVMEPKQRAEHERIFKSPYVYTKTSISYVCNTYMCIFKCIWYMTFVYIYIYLCKLHTKYVCICIYTAYIYVYTTLLQLQCKLQVFSIYHIYKICLSRPRTRQPHSHSRANHIWKWNRWE